MSAHLAALEPELAAVPGTVSVWCGPLGGPAERPFAGATTASSARAAAYERLADVAHYAASTMKVGVLAALHRAAEDGDLDLDTPVPVRNDFLSAAPGGGRFGCSPEHDSDREVWDRLDQRTGLRWLAGRMIVRSSNLATNILMSYVGIPAVDEIWRLAGATRSVTQRGIEDYAARDAGMENMVTAADLAALLGAIATGRLLRPDSCRQMLNVLLAQQHRDDLAAGLPAGTRIAHKSGWVRGVRHGAGVVFPDDAPPYAIAVCTTTDLATGEDGEDPACRLVARIAAASWADRANLQAH